MADDTGTADATSAGASTPQGATPGGQADTGRDAPAGADTTQQLRDAGRDALAKEREARREAERRAGDLEKRLQALEDAGKSEIERAYAQRDRQAVELEMERATRQRLETELASRDLLELKRQIATELGVPLEAAHRLQGDDVRSLKADAQRYLEERRLAEGDLGVGRGGAATGRGSVDMNTLIRHAAGRN